MDGTIHITSPGKKSFASLASGSSRVPSGAVVVPPEILPALRQAVYWEFGRASEGLVAIAQTPGHLDHPEWYEGRLAQLDAARGLLDALGWGNRDRPLSEARLDARTHGTILLNALRRTLEDSEHAGRTVLHDQRRRHCRRLVLIVQEMVGEHPHGSSSCGERNPEMPGENLASSTPDVTRHECDCGTQVLTARETEILVHLSRSRRYAEIAAILCIDVETVRTHARRIRRKLGVRRSRDLVGIYVPERHEPSAPSA